jgi:hypothetical protein
LGFSLVCSLWVFLWFVVFGFFFGFFFGLDYYPLCIYLITKRRFFQPRKKSLRQGLKGIFIQVSE